MPVTILNLPDYQVMDTRDAEREYHVKGETITPTFTSIATSRAISAP